MFATLVVAGHGSPALGRATEGSGVVETLEGPPCRAASAPGSTFVRSLVLDGKGGLYFDAGPPGQDWVVKADSGTRGFSLLQVPASGEGVSSNLRAGNRMDGLASDGQGGLIAARREQIFLLPFQGQPVLIAGASPSESQGSLSSGDGGPAAQAGLGRVRAIGSDESGNAYVADVSADSVRVRFINRNLQPAGLYPGTPRELDVEPGHIQTIALTQTAPKSDGPIPLPARGRPTAIEVAGGTLYLAIFSNAGDTSTSSVMAMNLGATPIVAHGKTIPPGEIRTLVEAKTPAKGAKGSKGGMFGSLPGLAADGAGSLFLADENHHRALKLDTQGRLTTLAGTGRRGFSGNGGTAVDARLNRPFDIEVSPQGLVYVSDQANGQIRVVDQLGLIHAASGTGLWPYWMCEHPLGPQSNAGKGILSRLDPAAVASGPAGKNVYFASTAKRRPEIKRIDPKGALSVAVDGDVVCPKTASCAESRSGRPGTTAPLGDPTALVAVRGGLYVLDGGNNRVLFANLGSKDAAVHGLVAASRSLVTVAGDGKIGTKGDGGPALRARLSQAQGIAVDGRGRLLIADTGNGRVREVDQKGKIRTILGGSRTGASEGCCSQPRKLAVNPAGNLYVADGNAGPVWFVNRKRAPVVIHGMRVPPRGRRPLTGSRQLGVGGGDGRAIQTGFRSIAAMSLDARGNLYLVDWAENTVQKIDRTGAIATVAGVGIVGFNGDGLKGPLTTLNQPKDVAVDECGNVVIADFGNQRVRRVNVGGECPEPRKTQSANASSANNPPIEGVVLLAVVVPIAIALVLRRRSNRQNRP